MVPCGPPPRCARRRQGASVEAELVGSPTPAGMRTISSRRAGGRGRGAVRLRQLAGEALTPSTKHRGAHGVPGPTWVRRLLSSCKASLTLLVRGGGHSRAPPARSLPPIPGRLAVLPSSPAGKAVAIDPRGTHAQASSLSSPSRWRPPHRPDGVGRTRSASGASQTCFPAILATVARKIVRRKRLKAESICAGRRDLRGDRGRLGRSGHGGRPHRHVAEAGRAAKIVGASAAGGRAGSSA
jgi:hypothetical protein